MRRMGKQPKDNHRDNVRRLRELGRSERTRRMQQEQEQERSSFHVPSAYQGVQSKIKAEIHRPSSAPPGGTRKFLRAGEKNPLGPPPKSARPYTARQRTKPPVPTAAEAEPRSYRPPKDCMKENVRRIYHLESKKKREDTAAQPPPGPPQMYGVDAEKFGRVPW